MPIGLKRYYGGQDLHFITCSCYERRPWLGSPARRTLFLNVLEQVRMHRNPVRRWLVLEPGQWSWSSFRFYAYHEPGLVLINAPGSAKLNVRRTAA